MSKSMQDGARGLSGRGARQWTNGRDNASPHARMVGWFCDKCKTYVHAFDNS